MAEFRSALAHRLNSGRFGAAPDTPPLNLSEQPLGTCFQIAGWPGDFDQASRPILEALGFSGLGQVGEVAEAGEACAFRVAPERVIVRTADPGAWDAAAGLADGASVTLLDFSHARTVIRLEGSTAPALLARVVSIDLHDAEFRETAFALTGIQSVPVMLHRLRDARTVPRFDVYIPYTWAASIWDLLCHCALPFGYEVRDPGP